MPGITGFYDPRPTETSVTERQLPLDNALLIDPAWEARRWRDDSRGVAMTTVGRDRAASDRSFAERDGSSIVMEGELYGVDAANVADFLLEGYLDHGCSFLAQLDGRFVAAIWSAAAETLTLLTDKFASKPLYYAFENGSFAFSTSIRALAALPDAPGSMNLDGVVQFFTFGHLWNNETFFQSIHCQGPATELQVCARSPQARESCYWRPSPGKRSSDHNTALDEISASLKRAVEMQSANTEGLGVALSGGLDARTMLALVNTDQTRPVCVSLGVEGSLDQLSAQRLAEQAGCEYRQLVLGEGFLESFRSHLERMVDLTDGHYLSQCIVMPTFPLYRELGVKVLLRGHVGELMHMHKAYNFSIDREFPWANPHALETWLWARLQSHLTEGVSEPLLKGVSAEEFTASGRRSLTTALDRIGQWDHPLDRVSQLFLDQRTRRETAMSLVKFNSVVDTRIPYLDTQVIESVFRTPPGLRTGERIQTHILRTHRPSFLKPANSNTGAPVGASAGWKKFCTFRMKVLGKLGFKGYQPYERLGLWLRQDLRPLVESTLLSPECLDRGLLNPECVRGVVSRHSRGEQNHTFLIMAMMILETGLRRLASFHPPTPERMEHETLSPGSQAS